jgi:hypothetical protein
MQRWAMTVNQEADGCKGLGLDRICRKNLAACQHMVRHGTYNRDVTSFKQEGHTKSSLDQRPSEDSLICCHGKDPVKARINTLLAQMLSCCQPTMISRGHMQA